MMNINYLAEYESSNPPPEGSIVVYQGSIVGCRDEPYMVLGDSQHIGFPGSLTIQHLDRVDNPPKKFGDSSGILYNVRPKSVELVVLP